MPKLSTSENIETIQFQVEAFNGTTPAANFVQLGVDISGVYYIDSAAVEHRVGGDGGGGATALTDLTDVSGATQTAGFVLASSGGDYQGRALISTDIPQLAASKITAIGARVSGQASETTLDTVGGFDAMVCDVEDYDTSAFHDNVTNNSRLTVPSGLAGRYDIKGIVRVRDTGGTQQGAVEVQIREGVSTLIIARVRVLYDSVSGIFDDELYIQIATDYQLDVGDYVELYVGKEMTSGGSNDLYASAHNFSLHYIGA